MKLLLSKRYGMMNYPEAVVSGKITARSKKVKDTYSHYSNEDETDNRKISSLCIIYGTTALQETTRKKGLVVAITEIFLS